MIFNVFFFLTTHVSTLLLMLIWAYRGATRHDSERTAQGALLVFIIYCNCCHLLSTDLPVFFLTWFSAWLSFHAVHSKYSKPVRVLASLTWVVRLSSFTFRSAKLESNRKKVTFWHFSMSQGDYGWCVRERGNFGKEFRTSLVRVSGIVGWDWRQTVFYYILTYFYHFCCWEGLSRAVFQRCSIPVDWHTHTHTHIYIYNIYIIYIICICTM